jgi:hypothetical protein
MSGKRRKRWGCLPRGLRILRNVWRNGKSAGGRWGDEGWDRLCADGESGYHSRSGPVVTRRQFVQDGNALGTYWAVVRTSFKSYRDHPSIDAALDLNPTKVSSVKVYVAPG